MTSCFVAQIDLNLADKLRSELILQGFVLSEPPYTLFQAKKQGISCTLYTSGKLTVQGKGMEEFIRFYLEPEILGTFTYGYTTVGLDLTPRLGVDESGKGDFFGPLCVAGAYGDEETIPKLVEIGVKDSKKIQDTPCLKLAEKIRKLIPYHVVRISPLKYNELYEKFGNLNLLLGWGHATVIESLLEKTSCDRVIIDQFAAEHVVENALKRKNKKVALTQRTKAEQDVVVAAASILARAAFLEGLGKLGESVHLILPKGASKTTLEVGKKLVEKHGPEILNTLAKLHFKTYQQIIQSLS